LGKIVFYLSLIFICISFFSSLGLAKKRYVTIGRGGVTGVYYPTGGAISKMINKKRKIYNIRASVESTGGSVYNINMVISGDLEFGIAQSDRQYQAYKGLAEWKKTGPQADLRSICSLHPEIITLVASVESKIKTLPDLKNKRINIGNPGSGHLGNALDILLATKLRPDVDFKAEQLKAAEAPKMLQDNRIDAFFYTVGHPNGAIKEATSGKRKVLFVALSPVDRLIQAFPYYVKANIPVKHYPMASNKSPVSSVGVVTTFVTSKKVDADVVYAITKELFDNLDEFKKLHPAFSRLTRKGMLKGLTAPLHEGAKKYYKEAGLI